MFFYVKELRTFLFIHMNTKDNSKLRVKIILGKNICEKRFQRTKGRNPYIIYI